jgi:antitoxin CptB
MQAADLPVDPETFNRLRWRCRRGLLENDLFLERFFKRYGDQMTAGQCKAMEDLMELHDHELLDLHLGRKTLSQVQSELDREDVREILNMLQTNP